MKICEDNVTEQIPEDQIFRIQNTLTGLRLLATGRADFLVDDLNSVLSELKQTDFSRSIIVAGEMESVPLFMFINRNHSHLVEKLTRIIKELNQEGLIELFYETAFSH